MRVYALAIAGAACQTDRLLGRPSHDRSHFRRFARRTVRYSVAHNIPRETGAVSAAHASDA